MLASITPLGERGRHNRWTLTVLFFGIGSAGAGTALGALLGALGALLGLDHAPAVALGALAGCIAAAAMLDLALDHAPGPRRQVDERWLDAYRGWVYGLGYGAQLGAGLATVVSSCATYATLAAAVLAARPGAGAVIVGVYGAVRGLSPLLAVRVRTPAQLMALHTRLQRWRGVVARASLVVLAALAAVALTAAMP